MHASFVVSNLITTNTRRRTREEDGYDQSINTLLSASINP